VSNVATIAARTPTINEARAVGTIALFVLGIAVGAIVHSFVDQGPQESPYASLPRVDEPQAAHDVVAAIANDDASALSKLLSSDQLNDLDTALQPIIDVRSAKFVGAVESEGRMLSGYVVQGKTSDGTDFIVGFVLRVANDQVVGVN
jgi:hypothetical protein